MADEPLQTQDSGASHTYPMEAGQIRKGGHIMIKGRPCKVTEVTSSKTGKHGHAKCHFIAADIFTGKKIEDLVPAGHNTNVPFVSKIELQCMDVDDEGFVSCMDDDGNTREDLKVPNEINPTPPGADELTATIKKHLEDGKDFSIVVLKACGFEQIIDTKVLTNN